MTGQPAHDLYGVAVETEQPSVGQKPAWGARARAAIVAFLDSWTASDAGIPPTGVADMAEQRWRVVVTRKGTPQPIRYYDWGSDLAAVEEQRARVDEWRRTLTERDFIEHLGSGGSKSSSAR